MSYLADRIGRKPVILGGITGLGISIASFGMSKSLAAMILSRCIGGALGGAWACAKIMVGEMTDRSNQGMAFQLLMVSWTSTSCIHTHGSDGVLKRLRIVQDSLSACLLVDYWHILRVILRCSRHPSGTNIPSLCRVSLLRLPLDPLSSWDILHSLRFVKVFYESPPIAVLDDIADARVQKETNREFTHIRHYFAIGWYRIYFFYPQRLCNR